MRYFGKLAVAPSWIPQPRDLAFGLSLNISSGTNASLLMLFIMIIFINENKCKLGRSQKLKMIYTIVT